MRGTDCRGRVGVFYDSGFVSEEILPGVLLSYLWAGSLATPYLTVL